MQFLWKVTSRLFQALWAACFSRQVIIDSLDVKIRSLWRSCLLLQNFLLFSELISLWLWSCVWDHYFDRLLVHHITASPSAVEPHLCPSTNSHQLDPNVKAFVSCWSPCCHSSATQCLCCWVYVSLLGLYPIWNNGPFFGRKSGIMATLNKTSPDYKKCIFSLGIYHLWSI